MDNSYVYKEVHFNDNSVFPISIYKSELIEEVLNEVPKHYHNEIEIILFQEGGVLYEIDGIPFKVKKNTILIINKDSVHSGIIFDFSKHKNIVYIFDLSILESTINDFSSNKYIFPIKNKETFFPKIIEESNESFNELKEILLNINRSYENKKETYELEIKALLFMFLSKLYQSGLMVIKGIKLDDEKDRLYIDKTLKYISFNYNKDISRRDVVSYLKINDSKFTRLFRKEADTNFSDYLNNYRIMKGAHLLFYTDLSITDIALDCGFKETSYFIRVFKKRMGVPPRKYRQNFLKLKKQ